MLSKLSIPLQCIYSFPDGKTSSCPQCLLYGSLMGYPSLMGNASRNAAPSKVIIVLPTNSRHDLLETRQLVLQVFHGVVQDVELCSLLANHLRKVIGLITRLG